MSIKCALLLEKSRILCFFLFKLKKCFCYKLRATVCSCNEQKFGHDTLWKRSCRPTQLQISCLETDSSLSNFQTAVTLQNLTITCI